MPRQGALSGLALTRGCSESRLMWAGEEGSGRLPPRSPGPLFPLPRRPALRLSSRSLARALCSSNNLIRFPRPPIEMRLTSACTRACGPSEAIPDPDPGSPGNRDLPGQPHAPFFSQDSLRKAAEKGSPGKVLPGITRQRGLTACGHSEVTGRAAQTPEPRGAPLALRRIPRCPPAQCPPTTLLHPPRHCKLFRASQCSRVAGGRGARGGPPPVEPQGRGERSDALQGY